MATATTSAVVTTEVLTKLSPILPRGTSSKPRPSPSNIRSHTIDVWSKLRYHVHTLWLFTFSDIKTVIAPCFVFGVTNALAAPAYNIDTTPTSGHLACRAPLCLLWIWAQLLPVDIANQCSTSAIAEDRLNKPWRPMPSGRLTRPQAKRVMVVFYVIAVLLSTVIGSLRQSLGLVALCLWYNYLDGSSTNWFVRNLVNALAYVCLTSGSLEVTLAQSAFSFEPRLAAWYGVICAAFCSTVQVQDMGDQEGDRARDRKTLPLVVGDGPARWMTMVPILVWGIVCPMFWNLGLMVRAVSVFLAAVIAGRCLFLRTVEADKKTYLYYNGWMASIFVLPLLAQMGW